MKMTIKEVEQILGIPRATVRFYEKEGLIEPKREKNGYRDYSQTDIIRLKKIIILRKIGLSVNDILDIFNGAKTMAEVLKDNIVNLQEQIDVLSGVDLCQ
jgi:DNA-binding transcriptional MerR regulator